MYVLILKGSYNNTGRSPWEATTQRGADHQKFAQYINKHKPNEINLYSADLDLGVSLAGCNYAISSING